MTSQHSSSSPSRLTLPEPTLTRLRTVGLVRGESDTPTTRPGMADSRPGIRSAVTDIGATSASAKKTAALSPGCKPVKNFMPNGLHRHPGARGPVVRLDIIASKPAMTC